ncbi:DUF4283 domain protein [Medicago truncatula]|uniref:DUF4283 domain protein n=1 Tax=Medicago truncatula TaxID=3880 RepID=A0A072UEK9_MEDTR|nr:DUF4283 domain protein [Medicago truncatula]
MIPEGPFCMYEEELLQEGLKQCKNSIIGKLLASKQISKQILHSSLMGIWCNPTGFKITELENNLYQFSFEKEVDINRILKGEPWIIRNVWLKLYLWNRNTNIQELDFTHAPLWIQVWGLPLHCKTIAMGHQIGAQIGKLEEAAIYEYPNNAKIIKVKVQYNISNPILAAQSGQGTTTGTSTSTNSNQSWRVQNMQTSNPLKRKSLPASHTVQVQQATTQDIIMASINNKASQEA